MNGREVNKGVLVARSKKRQEVSTQMEGQGNSGIPYFINIMSCQSTPYLGILCQIYRLDLHFTCIHHLHAPFKVRTHVSSPSHRHLYFESASMCALLGLLLLEQCID